MSVISATPTFDKQLLTAICNQRWFAQQNIKINSVEVLDWLLIEPQTHPCSQITELYWLKIRVAQTHYYSILVNVSEDDIHDANDATDFLAYLKLNLDGLKTHRGGTIRLCGNIRHEVLTDIRPFECGSSNSLLQCQTQHHAYIVKSYRVLETSNENEVRILRTLESQGLTPSVAGHIEYQLADRIEYLGVLTEHLSGVPIHKLFSQAIRSLIQRLNTGIVDSQMIPLETTQLKHLCHEIGRHVGRFHQQINHAFKEPLDQCQQKFDIREYIQNSMEVYQRVLDAVKVDTQLEVNCQVKIVANLVQCRLKLLNIQNSAELHNVEISIAHGDLHLAHIFVNPDNPQYCRIIDPSPITLDIDDPGFATQISILDLVGLHRGIEYFSFDEIIDAAGQYLNLSSEYVADALLHNPDYLTQNCPHMASMLESWSQLIVALLTEGYQQQTNKNTPSTATVEILYQTFYFGRLLRELEYNYGYGREFFKHCDLYYLRNLSLGLTS